MKELVNKLERLSQVAVTELLTKLETKLDADVFTYYGEIVNGVERNVKDIIEALAKDPNKHQAIYVFLTTPGGSLTPVQRMVDILRHFYSEVNFIVPDYAYSAGTIWCMSGDNIYMNYYSSLGPIDPQVQSKDGKLVAALGYLDKINELLEKAKSNELSDNNVWKSHGRPIGIQVLTEDLHLKIIDYEQDSELNDIISEYYDALSEYIRSHNYSGFFQTRLFI